MESEYEFFRKDFNVNLITFCYFQTGAECSPEDLKTNISKYASCANVTCKFVEISNEAFYPYLQGEFGLKPIHKQSKVVLSFTNLTKCVCYQSLVRHLLLIPLIFSLADWSLWVALVLLGLADTFYIPCSSQDALSFSVNAEVCVTSVSELAGSRGVSFSASSAMIIHLFWECF